jgi:hypothetical protein
MKNISLSLIYTEKKLSSNCAKRWGRKNVDSKLSKLYEYVKSISVST